MIVGDDTRHSLLVTAGIYCIPWLQGEGVVCPVDPSGKFTDEVTDYKGQYVKVRGDTTGSLCGICQRFIFT